MTRTVGVTLPFEAISELHPRRRFSSLGASILSSYYVTRSSAPLDCATPRDPSHPKWAS
ncbi:hypothetical protein Scep_005235 [Stephania cephalantha]|uniref:Uncharacterized protein n=1 Tax=Stephania cephalantha TaxID=152367 RepID=A0AAP0KTX9_9MAGN